MKKSKKIKKNNKQILPLLVFIIVLAVNFFIKEKAATQGQEACFYGPDGELQKEMTMPQKSSFYENANCDYGYHYNNGDLLFEYYGSGSDRVSTSPYGRKGSFAVGGNLVARNSGVVVSGHDSSGFHWFMTGYEEPKYSALGFFEYHELWYDNSQASNEDARFFYLTRSLGEYNDSDNSEDLYAVGDSSYFTSLSSGEYDYTEALENIIKRIDVSDSIFRSIPPAMDSLEWTNCEDDDLDLLCSEAEIALNMTSSDRSDSNSNGKSDRQDMNEYFYNSDGSPKTDVDNYRDYLGRLLLVKMPGSSDERLWYVHPRDHKRYYVRYDFANTDVSSASYYSVLNQYIKDLSGSNVDIIGRNNSIVSVKEFKKGLVYVVNDLIIGNNLILDRDDYNYNLSPFRSGSDGVSEYSKKIEFKTSQHSIEVGSARLKGDGLKPAGSNSATEFRMEGMFVSGVKKTSDFFSALRQNTARIFFSNIPFCGNLEDSTIAGCDYRAWIGDNMKVNGALIVSEDFHLKSLKQGDCVENLPFLDAFTADSYLVNRYNEGVIGYESYKGNCSVPDYQSHWVVCKDDLGQTIGGIRDWKHYYSDWSEYDCPTYVTSVDGGHVITEIIE